MLNSSQQRVMTMLSGSSLNTTDKERHEDTASLRLMSNSTQAQIQKVLWFRQFQCLFDATKNLAGFLSQTKRKTGNVEFSTANVFLNLYADFNWCPTQTVFLDYKANLSD